MVCFSGKGNMFVSCVIFRGLYTIHSEKQKALPPPAKSNSYLAVDLQHSEKLRGFCTETEVMDNHVELGKRIAF